MLCAHTARLGPDWGAQQRLPACLYYTINACGEIQWEASHVHAFSIIHRSATKNRGISRLRDCLCSGRPGPLQPFPPCAGRSPYLGGQHWRPAGRDRRSAVGAGPLPLSPLSGNQPALGDRAHAAQQGACLSPLSADSSTAAYSGRDRFTTPLARLPLVPAPMGTRITLDPLASALLR